MDRNQIIGFVLLALMLIGYISYNQYEQKTYEAKKKADSVAYARTHPRKIDSVVNNNAATGITDSATEALKKLQPAAYNGTAQKVVLENQKVAIEFSTKGAYPVAAQLKEYKTYEKTPFYLFNGAGNTLNAILPFDNGKATESLYFNAVTKTEADGSKTIDFVGDLGNGKKVDIIYTLPANDYMMRCNIVLTGMPAPSLKLQWNIAGLHTEKDITNERLNTQVYYRFKDEDHDYYTVRTNEEKSHSSESATAWVGFL